MYQRSSTLLLYGVLLSLKTTPNLPQAAAERKSAAACDFLEKIRPIRPAGTAAAPAAYGNNSILLQKGFCPYE